MKEENQAKTFSSRAQEELHYAGKQFYKFIIIAIVSGIVLYLSHFFSPVLAMLLGIVCFLLLLATLTYSVGHFIRYLIFSARSPK